MYLSDFILIILSLSLEDLATVQSSTVKTLQLELKHFVQRIKLGMFPVSNWERFQLETWEHSQLETCETSQLETWECSNQSGYTRAYYII